MSDVKNDLLAEDDLGGVSERFPFINNSLGRSESLLFLRNLHATNSTHLASAAELLQLLRKENDIFNANITKANTTAINNKLHAQIEKQNQLIHAIMQLQNLFANNEKLLVWLEAELYAEKILEEKAHMEKYTEVVEAKMQEVNSHLTSIQCKPTLNVHQKSPKEE